MHQASRSSSVNRRGLRETSAHNERWSCQARGRPLGRVVDPIPLPVSPSQGPGLVLGPGARPGRRARARAPAPPRGGPRIAMLGQFRWWRNGGWWIFIDEGSRTRHRSSARARARTRHRMDRRGLPPLPSLGASGRRGSMAARAKPRRDSGRESAPAEGAPPRVRQPRRDTARPRQARLIKQALQRLPETFFEEVNTYLYWD